MKHKKWPLWLITGLLAVCLSACQAPAGEHSAPLEESDSSTITESRQPGALPWEVPERETLSYEEYFSQVRTYEFEDIVWGLPVKGYRVRRAAGGVRYIENSDTGARLWDICSDQDLELVVQDYEWLYAIEGGTRLIRMDYWGGNRETLFEDESGLISRMNGAFTSRAYDRGELLEDGSYIPDDTNSVLQLADGVVMYFWAGARDGNGVALYRLYVPECRADVMHQYTQKELDYRYRFPDCPELEGDGPFYRVSEAVPLSNFEVAWRTGNPDFFRQFEAEMDGEYSRLGDTERMFDYSFAFQIRDFSLLCSVNTWTGEYVDPLAGERSAPLEESDFSTITESRQSGGLPWDAPERETLSYEEYFSQVREYAPEDIIFGWPVIEGYRVKRDGNALYLAEREMDGKLLWKICEAENLELVLADHEWLYAIEGGTRLIRMDYWGEKRETLFEDESGLISRMNGHVSDPAYVPRDRFGDGRYFPERLGRSLYLADNAVLYLWAGARDGDGAALYRLYVPECRADVMYRYTQKELDEIYRFPDCPELEGQGPFYRISKGYPLSNFSVEWSRGDPEFFQPFDAEMAGDYAKLTDREGMYHYAPPRMIPFYQAFCIQNVWTGEYREF